MMTKELFSLLTQFVGHPQTVECLRVCVCSQEGHYCLVLGLAHSLLLLRDLLTQQILGLYCREYNFQSHLYIADP